MYLSQSSRCIWKTWIAEGYGLQCGLQTYGSDPLFDVFHSHLLDFLECHWLPEQGQGLCMIDVCIQGVVVQLIEWLTDIQNCKIVFEFNIEVLRCCVTPSSANPDPETRIPTSVKRSTLNLLS